MLVLVTLAAHSVGEDQFTVDDLNGHTALPQPLRNLLCVLVRASHCTSPSG